VPVVVVLVSVCRPGLWIIKAVKVARSTLRMRGLNYTLIFATLGAVVLGMLVVLRLGSVT